MAGLALRATAADINVYFGCGCFWHVQHEFVLAEQRVLGRTGGAITSRSGYAGGTPGSGSVCYRTSPGQGFTEVVKLTIPEDNFTEFAQVYWSLFVGINRVDVQDVGLAYRAAVGLPGGTSSPLMAQLNAAQAGRVVQTFSLRAGQGSDPDTLGQALVWVYDSSQFPFYQGEMYHQFHDDMVENYPPAYNNLLSELFQACKLAPTACPNERYPSSDCGGKYHKQPGVAQSAGGGSGGGSGGSGAWPPAGTTKLSSPTSHARAFHVAPVEILILAAGIAAVIAAP